MHNKSDMEALIQECATLHRHLCPRQVLGIRMGLLGGELLGIEVPQNNKRMLTVVETDGCGADGIAVATNCWVGRRTMRILDFGKVAATFIDRKSEQAFRVYPNPTARKVAPNYAPDAGNRWEAYLLGYQRMPTDELLIAQPVKIAFSLEKLWSKNGKRVNCAECGEEIINEREVVRNGVILCRSCAGERYYHTINSDGTITAPPVDVFHLTNALTPETIILT